MADEQTFELLLNEFRRVGVDPDTFSAMLALRPEDALRALRSLQNDAGPSAFLAALRRNGYVPPISEQEREIKKQRDTRAPRRPRDKSA
jgi:hypothetical protein